MSTSIGIADRIFLAQESTATPQHVAALGVFAPPQDAAPDYLHRLVESLRSARTFAPPFNHRLRTPGLKAVAPAFVELADDEVDLDYHFRHSALPRPGGERELGMLVSRLQSRPLDMSKPLWEAHLIEGLERDRFAFYFKVHHALMDGVGGARRLQGMLSPDARTEQVRPLWSVPPRRSSGARDARRSPLGVAGAAAAGVGTAAGVARAAAGMVLRGVVPGDAAVSTPYRVPGSLLNGRVGQQRRVATHAIEFARVRAVADRAGVTVNDVFLAICAGGLRRYLEELDALPASGLVAGTPVSLRSDTDGTANNAFTMATMKLYTDIADPVRRLQAINRSSRLTKESLTGFSKAVAENYGALVMAPFVAQNLVGLGGRLKPPYNVAISNVPGPLEPQYLAGARLEMMCPLAVLYHGNALFIASLTVSEKMCLGFVGDRDGLPHLQRIAVYTGAEFDDLEVATLRA